MRPTTSAASVLIVDPHASFRCACNRYARGNPEPMMGLALQLRALGAEVPVCAPPRLRELARAGVPGLPVGMWR